jgi:hypothetical protein
VALAVSVAPAVTALRLLFLVLLLPVRAVVVADQTAVHTQLLVPVAQVVVDL